MGRRRKGVINGGKFHLQGKEEKQVNLDILKEAIKEK